MGWDPSDCKLALLLARIVLVSAMSGWQLRYMRARLYLAIMEEGPIETLTGAGLFAKPFVDGFYY